MNAQRRRRPRNRALPTIWFLAVFAGTLTVLWRADQPPLPVIAHPAGQFVVGGLELGAAPIEVSDSGRPVYHASIVPGGVRSADEVVRAMDRDPVVAAHYADIDVPALRRARLDAPTTAHVSYRIGDQVYFTSKKLNLKAGERVLTDGRTTIREQCGNIISMAPLGPTSSNEPPTEQFDVVVSPIASPAHVLAQGTPAGTALSAVPPSGAPRANTASSGRTPPSRGGSITPGGFFSPGMPSLPLTPPGTSAPSLSPDGDPPLTTPPAAIPPPPGFPPLPWDFPPPPADLPAPPWDFLPPPSDPLPPYLPSASEPLPDPSLPVPEPSTFVLLGIGGAVGLAKLIRSRRAGK